MKKHIKLAIAIVVSIIACFVTFIITLSSMTGSLNPILVINSLQKQPVEFSQEELYQNLHGFELDGETITSLHYDPWIDISMGETRLGLRMYINLVLEEEQVLNSQIFYRRSAGQFSEERSFWFYLHNGLNVIQEPISSYDYLRLDLTNRPDESMVVVDVIVDNYQYNWVRFWATNVGILLLLILVCLYIGNEKIPRVKKIYGIIVSSNIIKKWSEIHEKEKKLLTSIQSIFKHSKWFYITTLIVLIGCYLFTLANPSMGIDDFDFDIYFCNHVSLMTGRWTYIVWMWVFGTLRFLPMSTDFIVVISLYISAIIYAHILDLVSRNQVNEVGKIIFSCGIISFSYTAHLFVFMTANINVMPVFLLTSICMLVFYKMWKNELNKVIGSIIFIFMGMMANDYGYQFIVVALFVLLLLMLTFDDERVLTLRKTFLATLFFTGLTVLSIIGYFGIGRLLQRIYGVGQKPYTAGFFQHDFSQGADAVLAHVVQGIRNLYQGDDTMRTIFVISVILLVAATINSIRKRKVMIFVVAVLLCLSPFLLAVLLGNMNLPLRTRLHIALLFGFALFYIYDTLRRIPIAGIILKYCSGIIIAIVILNQVIQMNLIFYIDYQRYQFDRHVSQTIITDINRVNTENKPILILGVMNANHPYGGFDFVGNSIFWWNRAAFLHSELHSREVLAFWDFMGYNNHFTLSPIPENELLFELFESMPAFPQDGYIIDAGDFILIKIGEYTNLVRYVDNN